MSVPADLVRSEPGLGDWCILHAYRGSIAHGMYQPNDQPTSIDDKDTMAICVPPERYYLGCGDFPTVDEGHGPYFREYGNHGTREIVSNPWDVVVYDVRKAIWLMMVGNPNMLSLLWVPNRLRISTAPAGELLLANRAAFVGRHVYRSFVGYAKDQLYKMTHVDARYEGYMGQKRRALFDQFGYDTKNASHLVRLLRMGIEFLRDGELLIDRGGYDAAELLSIKRGEWSATQVREEAARLFRRAEDAYDRSTLPARPDEEAIASLCVEVVREAWAGR